jgi:short-subunit dehydrogenase
MSENSMGDKRRFAIVTGASSGIGLELAKCCAREGFDLLIAADEPDIHDAATELQATGVAVEAVQADLATAEGIEELYSAAKGRPIDALLANAGRGLGKAFLDQDFDEARRVVDTNVTGTICLIHKVGNEMRAKGGGKILITGSIAGFTPGAFQAVYHGTKAFIDSFSHAIRNELKDTGITVTCLMPGATDTEFFERADLMDTKIGQEDKDDAADVAQQGFRAMLNGDAQIITNWHNKMTAAMAHVLPAETLAEQSRKETEPGSGDKA